MEVFFVMKILLKMNYQASEAAPGVKDPTKTFYRAAFSAGMDSFRFYCPSVDVYDKLQSLQMGAPVQVTLDMSMSGYNYNVRLLDVTPVPSSGK